MRESLHLFPYRIVYLTGVDGSGKTYFANRIIDVLESRGIRTKHVWSRFNNYLSKPLLAYTRLIGLNHYETHNGIKTGYHEFENHHIISSLFIICQLIDVWIASITKFWFPSIFGGVLILSDRGPHDTLLDVTLDTGFARLPETTIGRLFLKSIPFRHKVYLVVRDRDKIEATRPDVKRDRKFEKRMLLYLENEERLGFHRISNNGLPEETLSVILKDLLLEGQKATQLD